MAACTAIVGTGSWGAAMSTVAAAGAGDGGDVVLWGRSPEKTAEMARSRRHPHLDAALPRAIEITADGAALERADLVLWAVPTQHSAAIAARLAPHLRPDVPVVSLSKGLEQETLRRVTEVLHEAFGERPYGCCSGPSHAEEVVAGLPAALVTAGPGELTALVVDRLHGQRFRLYTSEDLCGVELGGALKNVVAVAAGICDGLRLGDNAKAALVTRGLAEMRRLGRALGAQDATFAGLAGIGDLLATCYSPYGRNRALGLAVGRGAEPRQHLAASGMVAEGAWTCRAAVALGERFGCELPIASQVASVLWDAKPVRLAIEDLLTRSAKEEDA